MAEEFPGEVTSLEYRYHTHVIDFPTLNLSLILRKYYEATPSANIIESTNTMVGVELPNPLRVFIQRSL